MTRGTPETTADGKSSLLGSLQYLLHLTHVRMRQDVRAYSLGLVWWYLDPVINTLVLYWVVAVVLGLRTDDMMIFLLTGLLMFRYLQGTITQSCNSLNPAMTLSSRVYVPKLAFVLRDVLAETLKFVIGVAFLLMLALVLGNFHASALEVIAVIAVAVVFATGAATLVSFASALVRDVRPVIGYVFRALFFLSGTFFALDKVPEEWRTVFLLNPFALLMHEFRLAVNSSQGLDWGLLGALFLVSSILTAIGVTALVRFDRKFPKYMI
ncbi:MAG: ABC transporter permease [Hyphomicrobiaceae bacterium]|nr:ABC transporter permease [Hyphomicrobiaceae bacterium]